jgi:NhaP-type Na+/H+ or K+/H+ antiporter
MHITPPQELPPIPPGTVSVDTAMASFQITFALFLFFFFAVEACFEKYHPKIGHATCLTIILGIIWSFCFYAIFGSKEPNLLSVYNFPDELFFNVILPPIIFNSGFSMKRKKFFENIGNIMIFGLVVTLICFVIYSASSYWALKYLDLTMTNYFIDPSSNLRTLPITIRPMQLFLFTSLLCSSDVVAAVSIVDYNAMPKLYSCIFGEGVFNDIVSIVLFSTVEALQGTKFTNKTPFVIFGQFFTLGIVSIAIGVVFGFSTSLIFKHFRMFSISAVTETFIILAMGFLAYFTAYIIVILNLEMSGIISMLTYAIIQSHYTWYNLSP